MFSSNTSSSGVVTDPQFNYVTMLLHGNGTNGAQNNTFLDSSTNNFTITRNGNTTQGTFAPYGNNWSNYFDGTGDYLTAGAASNWQFLNSGASDYTIEAWVYLSSVSAQQFICATNAAGAAVGISFQVTSSATLTLEFTRGVGGSFATFTSTGTLAANAWNHVAVTFATSGKTATFYINGASAGSSSNTGFSYSTSNPSNTLNIGREPSGSGLVTGYISNLRIVSSIVYTSAFTPPTSPLTAITNTSLLTCQSNRFIDNSSNAFTITRNGDVSVQRFSPFSPTAPYAAGTDGGSGYFDGSGDYLSVPDNAALDLSTGDFTIECWVFPITGISDFDGLISKRNQSTFTGNDWRIAYRSASTAFGIATGANNTDRLTPAITLNAWNHIAFVRSSGTLSCYANGTRGDNLSWTENLDNSEALLIGLNVAGYDFPGYISNVRIVKGTAVYSGSTYTVPTSPLTAITNTSLLLNFTNAGIIDNAEMNDLETVGNAQISTAQSKFGGGSISVINSYLDGCAIASSPQFAFGTGNWTIEGWFYTSQSGSAKQALIMNLNQTTGMSMSISTSSIEFRSNGTTDISGSGVSSNTWTHIAWVRNGNTVTIYKDGTSITSGTYTNSIGPSKFYVGPTGGQSGVDGNTYAYLGYIDDLRITKGYARYTANFTAPTAPFPTQ